MQMRETTDGAVLETAHYTARCLRDGPLPALLVLREGQPLFRLPMVAGLAQPDAEEKLTDVQVGGLMKTATGACELVATASSSLWGPRIFRWTFTDERIEFQHFAEGRGPLGRCYFFSNGVSGVWNDGASSGGHANTTVFTEQVFGPKPNHANQWYYTPAAPLSLGILRDIPPESAYNPLQLDDGLFAPPPLCLGFGTGSRWAGVGLGEQPGLHLFNALEYTGSRFAGASFYVNYAGFRCVAERFASPVISIHFGFSEFEALQQYMAWLNEKGFATAPRYPSAAWHRQPIFCGWAEQVFQATLKGVPAGSEATQANYEQWITTLEARGLLFGTIVIDDKWQAHYGDFAVDTAKWPDMPGFIAAQHRKGRHVLLWVPGYHVEGLDERLCVVQDGKPVAADVGLPEYEAFLRERVRHLVKNVGADGFKLDWVTGLRLAAGARLRSGLYGIEILRRFQFILHDEAHKWKPDAMVETQSPHPLFRESSDVLRLNDIWYATRNVTAVMRIRARIARLAGWDLVDCDNASSTTLHEWWNYMLAQPEIGIPSLYLVSRMEATLESVPEERWAQLAALWNRYIQASVMDA